MGLALGCASPTLPLPPPSAEVSPPNAQGLVQVDGTAVEGATVLCENERTQRGVTTRVDDTGRYDLAIEARSGDSLALRQLVGTDLSGELQRLVPEELVPEE